MFRMISDIWQRRELLLILAGRNLKVRYKNSVLGFFWSLLVPLIFIAIYSIFARILKFNDGTSHYLEFLIIGIIVWQYLSMSLNDSLHAVAGNSNLIKKTSFPRIILPLSTITANLINFLLTLCVLVVYLLIMGIPMSHLAWLPLVIIAQFVLCFGLSLIISTLNVFYRDVEHMIGVVTLAWFFLTPIFYPMAFQLDRLPWNYKWLIFLNPMTGITDVYRAIFMSTPVQYPYYALISVLVSVVILLAGLLLFNAQQDKFADEL